MFFRCDNRINRLRYFLRLFGLTFVYGAISGILSYPSRDEAPVVSVIITVISLFAVWSSCTLMIRRLHDLDRSGFYVIVAFIPVFNLILGILLLFVKGTRGKNQYGADPLEKSVAKNSRTIKTSNRKSTLRNDVFLNAGAAIATKCIEGYDSNPTEFVNATRTFSTHQRLNFSKEMIYLRLMIFDYLSYDRLPSGLERERSLLRLGATSLLREKLGQREFDLIPDRIESFDGIDIPDMKLLQTVLRNAQISQSDVKSIYAQLSIYFLTELSVHIEFIDEVFNTAFNLNHH